MRILHFWKSDWKPSLRTKKFNLDLQTASEVRSDLRFDTYVPNKMLPFTSTTGLYDHSVSRAWRGLI